MGQTLFILEERGQAALERHQVTLPWSCVVWLGPQLQHRWRG